MGRRTRSPLLRYGIATLGVALALLARLLLNPYLDDHLPFVTFLIAVMAAAWYGGVGPSLFALAAGFLAGDWYFVPPRDSLLVSGFTHWAEVVEYWVIGLAIALFGEAVRVAQRRAESSAQKAFHKQKELEYEIGERVQAVEALRESEDRLRVAVESADMGTWDYHPLTGKLQWSERCKAAFGLRPDAEVTYDTYLERVHPDDRERTHQAAQAALDPTGNGAFHTEYRSLWPDGTTRWISAQGQALFEGAGPRRRATRFIGTVLDVTDRKQDEEALRQGEERLRLALRAGRMGSWDHDIEGGAVTWAEGTEELFGLAPGSFGGSFDAFLERVHAEDRERVESTMLLAIAQGSDHEAEFRVVWPDGGVHWVSARGRVLRDPRGRSARVIGVAIDFTERRAGEEALRRSESRFRQLADAMPQMVWTARPDGYLDYFNRRWYEFTGLPEGRGGDDSWTPILHPDDVQPCRERWYQAVHSGEVYEIEYRFRDRGTGGYRWHLGRALPVRDETGKIVKWFGTCTDIDDQKRGEEALKDADRRKDEFLAMLAHELRNPLAPIQNAVQILRAAGRDRPDLEWSKDVIGRQVQQLTRLVDDLLDVSRITRGKIKLQKEPVDVAVVVARAVETSRPLIDARKHHLTVALPPEPVQVEADQARLAQVLANLLNNAAKYTEEGGCLWLTAGREGRHVVFRVRDTGVGIASEMLTKVFELFTQAENSLARSQGGLGIGLTLVRSLVEMHGGSVQAHSGGPGQGSEFVVRLPLWVGERRVPGPVDDVPALAAELSPRRVLIVDDNIDAAESMAILLGIFGHEVHTVHDGESALEAARAFQPEIVLLDIGLPGMDGYEVARRLRQEFPREGLFLVALTGYGQAEDRRRSREAGFDRHLVKPVEPGVLEHLFAALPVAQG